MQQRARVVAGCAAAAAGAVVVATICLRNHRAEQRQHNQQLLSAIAHTVAARGKILDLRDEAAFVLRHLKGARNVSHTTLWAEDRWYELPDKLEQFAVVLPGNKALAAKLRAQLLEHRPNITWCLCDADVSVWK